MLGPFEALGYYASTDDPGTFLRTANLKGTKAFFAHAEGLDQVMIVHLRRWLIDYQGMPTKVVDEAIAAVLAKRQTDV